MTNAQLYLAIGLPMFTLVIAMIMNMVQISGIRADLASIRADVQSLREDIREIRADIKLLTGKVYDMMKERP